MKLSTNFSVEEITSTPWDQISSPKKLMIQSIVTYILQPIRNVLALPMRVTSGMRTPADYDRLIYSGYNPSDISDHFYGEPVPVHRPEKQVLFGKTYTYSVGAVDFTVGDNESAFNKIKDMVNNRSIQVGQLIHEYGNNMNWIHVSNPPTLVYSGDFVKSYLQKPMLLTSADAGKTYQGVV